MKIFVFLIGILSALSVSAESLEDRVKSLEAKVAELQEMIAKLSIAALGATEKSEGSEGSEDKSVEESLAALMLLAAMSNALDESKQESEVSLDCIKELDAKTKPLEKNSLYTTVGWMLKYQSTCKESVEAWVNIEWYTSDGFLLEEHSALARFDPTTEGQVSGEKKHFSTEKYNKVGKFKVSLGQ